MPKCGQSLMSRSPSLPERPHLDLDPEMSDAERLSALRQHFERMVDVNRELDQRLQNADDRHAELVDEVDQMKARNEALKTASYYIATVEELTDDGVIIKQHGNNQEVLTEFAPNLNIDDIEPGDRVAINDSFAVQTVLDDETGELESTGETIMSGTLKEVLARLQVGLPLDGTGAAGAMAGEQSAYAGTGSDDVSGDVTNPCVCLEWEVPTSVENEIQGDSLMFDLQFHALQARHNDGTANPCADFSLSTDYSTPEGHGNSTDGSVLTTANFGDETVSISFTFQDDDDGVDFLDPSDYSPTNLPMAIDADTDGTTDFQLAWEPNAGFPDDPFAYINHPSGGGTDAPEDLPSGYSATKTGNTITFGMPRSVVGSDFRFFVFASTGGEGPVVEIDQNPNDGSFDFFDSSDHVEVSAP